ncbi:hypothetical protein IWQ61_008752 [Dispira simplex]|nr:hypothetical protein IWQ61_008752 [Dispira simplex]
MVGYEDSTALKFYILWARIWMHAGIIYSIIVVVVVCFKIFAAQFQLRHFGSNNLNERVSRSLIHNTYLIIAYPVVLFVVYIPYILQSWFVSHIPEIFNYHWGMFTAIMFSTQGIFSFIIVLFHPVMLSTYHHNNFGLNSLWSQMSRWRHGSHCDTSNGSGIPLYPPTPITDNSPIKYPMLDVQPFIPQVKTMDVGPGVTNLFDNTFRINNIRSTIDDEEKPNDSEIMAVIHVTNCELNESTLGPHHSFDEATYL